MIRWMLERLERDPYAVFYERELRERFLEEFDDAVQQKLVKRVPVGANYSFGVPRPLTLDSVDGGGFEAFDDDEPEADPLRLTAADVARWQLDLDELSQMFRERNGLDGEAGALSPRLQVIGTSGRDAVVLGLLLRTDGLEMLRALASRLASHYDRVVVVCPTFAPSAGSGRELDLLGIRVIPLDRADALRLDLDLRAPSGSRSCSCGMEHRQDFRWISRGDEEFSLTPPQATAIEVLHDAFLSGRPDMTWGQISTKLPTSPASMSQVFKGEPRWRSLVLQPRRDLNRLNVLES